MENVALFEYYYNEGVLLARKHALCCQHNKTDLGVENGVELMQTHLNAIKLMGPEEFISFLHDYNLQFFEDDNEALYRCFKFGHIGMIRAFVEGFEFECIKAHDDWASYIAHYDSKATGVQ